MSPEMIAMWVAISSMSNSAEGGGESATLGEMLALFVFLVIAIFVIWIIFGAIHGFMEWFTWRGWRK